MPVSLLHAGSFQCQPPLLPPSRRPTILRCSASTARSQRSRSIALRPSIRSICRLPGSSSSSAQKSKPPTRSRCWSSKEGRSFCAGGDLQTIGAAAASDTIAPVVGEMLKHYHAFITTLRRMPKVVLASVHGSAAGAGLSLAFVADLCIAAQDAKFTPAYSKLGVSPDGGGTVGVVASVGPRRALQIYLAEDSFSADQAYQWGLVAKVVPAAELKAATRELALRLAQNAPAGLAATKALIHRSPTTPIEQQLDAERDAIIDCMHTEEFRVAVKKFTSKGK